MNFHAIISAVVLISVAPCVQAETTLGSYDMPPAISSAPIETDVASFNAAATIIVPERSDIAPGLMANAWLNAQSRGTMASSNPQAAQGVQRDKAAERFMKTYDFPIKESFYGDKFKAGK